MKYLKVILIFFICLSVFPINAKLKKSKLSKLIEESELIIKAKVVQSTLNQDEFSGYAILKIEDIYKGSIEDKKIILNWSSEVHDQKLLTIGETRLFFLKETEGKLTGTHYGRSYVPLLYNQAIESVGYFIEYKYPTDEIIIDEGNLLKGNSILKIRREMPFTPIYSDSIIILKDLIDLIKNESEL